MPAPLAPSSLALAAARDAEGWPRAFELVAAADRRRADLECEDELLTAAGDGLAWARLWHARTALVVPRTYLRHEGFEAVAAEFATQGCPVWVRGSGGGLVPQGAGILNLSLAWRSAGPPGREMENIYRRVVDIVARALAALGVSAAAREVKGSFCDGRFNLAVGERKLAGTAQQWTRDDAMHRVLAHAVILVDADLDEAVERCNRFEAALHTPRRYERECVTSLREVLGAAMPHDLEQALREALAQQLRGVDRAPPI